MAKADVFNEEGEKIREMELPKYFDLPYREDIINKVYEALKLNARAAIGRYALAGKETSASGKVRHVRRRYRTAYGRGISRVPRKILLRRKPQGFYWVGAFIPSARGGYRAHPPKPLRRELKINKKEKFLALLYALSATANKDIVKKRYKSLQRSLQRLKELQKSGEEKIPNLPILLDISLEKIKKAKELKEIIEKVFQNFPALKEIIFKKRKVRAGKGKLRGRRYKSSAGLLLVVSNSEFKPLKTTGIAIAKASNLSLKELAPGNIPGRLTAFTVQGFNELNSRINAQAEKLNLKI
ncbi:MAG: 50S ribosomal protein L4 [Candidatus Pacearchaeota archaeon]